MQDYNAHPLSDMEQISTEQRILDGAILIRNGARIDRLGRLLLTQEQLGYVQETGNLVSPVNYLHEHDQVDSTERDLWLDQGIDDLEVDNQQMSTRLKNALDRERIESLRDIIVVGRNGLLDIRNFGVQSLKQLEVVISENEYGIEWSDSPTIEEIAAICERLDQVNALALNSRPELGSIYLEYAKRRTVLDVLNMEAAEFERTVHALGRNSNLSAAKNVAVRFAQEFFKARAIKTIDRY